MSPSRRRLALAHAILTLAAGAASASCLAEGELVVVVDTDMQPGKDIDSAHIEILRNGELEYDNSATTFPASVGVLPSGNPDEPITIRVTALKGDVQRVLTERVVQVSDTEVEHLQIPIPFLCDTLQPPCPEGRTCAEGVCIPMELPSALIADYPREGLFAQETCFEASACFDGAALAPVDFAFCRLAPSGDVNIALLTGSGGYCKGEQCIVVLNQESLTTADDGRVQLPPGVCLQIATGRVLGVMTSPVSPACPKKTSRVPTAGPWSSVPACVRAPSPGFESPWRGTGDIKDARAKHTATLLDDGRVLVTGGIGDSLAAIGTVEAFNPASSTWAKLSSMATPRSGHTATLLPSGQVLVAGGANEGDGLTFDSAEVFTGAAWQQPTSAMSSPRFLHTATLLVDGDVLVAGGFSDTNGTVTDTADTFSPAAAAFTGTAVMRELRAGHTATLLEDGTVLLTGGQIDETSEALLTTERYDPDANTWTDAAPMLDARTLHTATRLSNDQVLVAGGAKGTATGLGDAIDTAEIYDRTTDTWTCARKMNIARYLHTATLLTDGRVIVVGGNTPQGTTAPAEIYDPSTNTWTVTTVPQNLPRAGHTATMAQSDELIIVGGVGLTQSIMLEEPTLEELHSALIYVPSCVTAGNCPSLSGPFAGGCEDGTGGGSSTTGGAVDPAAIDEVQFQGSGCAGNTGVTRDGCSLGANSQGRAIWALALGLLLVFRRLLNTGRKGR